jgi:hypothetical protein
MGDVIFGVFMFCFGIWVGVTIADDNKIQACKKANNVYQCEVIAVPTLAPGK